MRGNAQQLTDTIQQLVDRSVRSRRVHGLVLGVQFDDGTAPVRVAAGDARATDSYHIASITKMFTASVIFQLIDEGRLRLDDRVANLLPDLDLTLLHVRRGVDSTDRIEVQHLLHQTSGLGDYFADGFEDRMAAGEDLTYSIQDTVDIARRVGPSFSLADRGGQRSSYSDVNWQLLTGVVERLTGQSYWQVVRERIADPLCLNDTYVFPDDIARPEPSVLRVGDQSLSIPGALTSERGAGGIVSTLDDQLRFSQAFHAGELFAGGIERASAPGWNRVLNFAIGYGHGVMRYRLPRWVTGRRVPDMFGHSGSTASFLFHIPDLGVHVAGTFDQFADAARPFRFLPRLAGVIAAAQR